ncbi:hypothetical protein [Reinekea blandensis]|uniref:Uncharacterized protein n=1 Tax=Reinekea blandensis MED297 TaxID=314283 RepID=A4BJF0_9GAMM|nr:hypothetical protein [Reinekea blandensis]EAR07722.1 hypothetical protein MED297_01945 [Reinekea sp. MED297] [Reinekea blandensis MED297]
MDVENMAVRRSGVFVERIRWSGIPAILAAVHFKATFLSAAFINKLRHVVMSLLIAPDGDRKSEKTDDTQK